MRFVKYLIIFIYLCDSTTGIAAPQDSPAIAVASDLKFALDAVAARFRSDAARAVRLSYGSSGNYFRQITQGAPYQVFLSADEDFALRLHRSGHTEDRGVLYATGRIVLFAPTGSPLQVDDQAAGLRTAVAGKMISRFAIANPEHAPYGRAAAQALRTLGLWDAMQGTLVLGENVSQAAHFAVSGSAQGGILAYALALSPDLAKRGRYVLLPEHLHAPLRQRMVLIKGAGATARAFYAFLQQPVARKILQQYGFAVPAGTPQ